MPPKPVDSAALVASLPMSMQLDLEDLMNKDSVGVIGAGSIPEDVLLILDSLPEPVRLAVEAAFTTQSKLSVVDRAAFKYSCVYMRDGDYPYISQYGSLENLVRALGQELEEDVFAIPFFGAPLGYTKGSPRYLLLPDRLTAVNIPLHNRELIQSIAVDLLDLDEQPIQDDFYLGLESAATAPKDDDDAPAPRRERGFMDGRKPKQPRTKPPKKSEGDESAGDDDTRIT